MDNQLLITQQGDFVLTVWIEEKRIQQIQAEPVSEEGILGNIYVGKVRNIVKNINAAFVEFKKGQMGYLPLSEQFCPIHTDGFRQNQDRVLIGDEIIVQVEREAIKTKPPTLTGNLNLSGKYVVLTVGKPFISLSRKICGKELRQKLHTLLEEYDSPGKEYGWIARTNSAVADEEEIRREIELLLQRYEHLMQYGTHRSQFCCLYQTPAAYLENIKNMYQEQMQEIITDSDMIFQEITAFLQENHWDRQLHLTRWNPENGTLDAVFQVSRTLQKLLQPKVWLKSGGYLVIQPTEALVSIDVNTGKAILSGKDVQNHFFKINREAALEIAKQLRLRNLSGIILVDFIDLDTEEAKQKLLRILRHELDKDPIPTKLVDMTKLGLVEITRKKVRKPLYEQLLGNKNNVSAMGE